MAADQNAVQTSSEPGPDSSGDRLSDDESVQLPGYPGFANKFCSADYMNFRQFKYLRMRMLLRKQFEIERLQDALHVLDQQDDKDNPLWLISQQLDANEKRKEVFAQLDTTLLAYDDLLKRTQFVMATPEPSPETIRDVRFAARMYLVKPERKFLEADLFHIGGTQDPKLGKLLRTSEYLVGLFAAFRYKAQKLLGFSNIEDGFTVPKATFRKLSRALAAVLSVVILLLPVLILNFVETSGMRLLVVFLSAAAFIAALTTLTIAGTMEVFVAGATYSAVLVVFVSQNGAGGSGS